MPIYEYRCQKCKEEFEALVFRSGDKVTCPHCKGTRLQRLMSGFAHKSGETFVPSSGSAGCASCSSGNCSSCH